MKIDIHYCTQWNYKPRAQGLSDEILKVYPNADIRIKKGGDGQFDIIYESDPPALLFSKQKKGRFPTTDEILEKLK